MPIIINDELQGLSSRLRHAGAVVLDEDQALKQDIRPARIGLLNLMPAPAMESTENQWLRYISNTVLQIEPVLFKFDEDSRERPGASRQKILERYIPFSEVRRDGLDGLIVTGDNLELRKDLPEGEIQALQFGEITYGNSLKEIIDWARENVFSTIYSCLGSHFALNHLYGIDRSIPGEKIFGVFEHEIKKYSTNPLVQGMDDAIMAPHSRWGTMDSSQLKNNGIEILAENGQVGWLLASDKNTANGFDIFLQGHPEYDKYDLHSEFLRDWENGQKMPKGYYDSNNPAAMPRMTWANDARALHANWMSSIYRHFSVDMF